VAKLNEHMYNEVRVSKIQFGAAVRNGECAIELKPAFRAGYAECSSFPADSGDCNQQPTDVHP